MRELPDYIYTSIQGKLLEKSLAKSEAGPEPRVMIWRASRKRKSQRH
jgi:hypothetical protein